MTSINDHDDDDISLCSTTWTELCSDYGEGKDYTVDRILAEERDEDEEVRYLLKWSGYPTNRAQWVGEDDVPTECIQVWLEHQDRIKAKQAKPFNVKQWAIAVTREEERKQVRKERRAAKRKRLGIRTKYRAGQRPPLAGRKVVEATEDALFEPERASGMRQAPSRTQPVPSGSSKPSSSIDKFSKPQSSSESTREPLQIPLKKTTTVAPTARKPNIFAKWSEKTQPKKRDSMSAKSAVDSETTASTKLARPLRLSHVHRINKAAANEPAPHSYEAVLAASAANQAPGATHTSSIGGISNSAPSPVPEPSVRIQEPTAPQPDWNHKIRRTCWYWARDGGCNKSDRDCKFVHAFGFELSHPPAGWKPKPKWYSQTFAQPSQQIVQNPTLASPPVTASVDTLAMANDVQVEPAIPQRPEPIKVRLSSEAFEQVNVKLHAESPSIAHLLMSTRGPEPHLKVNFSMTEQAYAIFMSTQPLSSVSIHYGDVAFVNDARHNGITKTSQGSGKHSGTTQPDSAGMDVMVEHIEGDDDLSRFCMGLEKQAQKLGCEATASVIVHKAWALLLYQPTNAAHFGDGGMVAIDSPGLRFQLIAPLQALNEPPTISIIDDSFTKHEIVFVTYIYRMFAGLTSKDINDMFNWNATQSLDRRVFLRFEGHPHERDLMTMLLESAGVTVTNSDTPKAWEDFVHCALKPGQPDTGVVIFHPANRRFHRVQQLWLLMNRRINFYIIGPCTDDFSRGYDTFETVQVWKPFADGTATLIMDDLFENHPERAYRVVEYIVKKAENKPFDKRTWKLFARPRVLDWLMDLAEKHKGTGAAPVRMKLVNAIWDKLCPLETRLPPELADPARRATLMGPTPLEYERHCEDFKARPPWERQVLFFAMWALDMCFEFRRFVVVVPVVTPELESFKAKWGHVDVLTPEKYLDRYNR